MSYKVGDKVFLKNPKNMIGMGHSERVGLQKLYDKQCVIDSISGAEAFPIRKRCGEEPISTPLATAEIKLSHNVWQGSERSKYENTGKI